jgi:membrane protein
VIDDASTAGNRVDRSPERARWWQVLRRVWDGLGRHHVSIMAAGVAFYGLLSIFPGLSVLISVYGLVADRREVESQLNALVGVLPAEALQLVADQMHSLIDAEPAKLGLGLLVGLGLALWSAMSGTITLMQALTIAFDENDDRGLVRFYLTAAVLTVGSILLGLLSLLLVAVIPPFLDRLPFAGFWIEAASCLRWPILAGLAVTALAILYRFAPCQYHQGWPGISPGAVVATLLWLAGSVGFSFYVSHFSSYDKTYGALGAVVILLMWFYVTAYIILAGAELDTAIDYRRAPRAFAGPTT